MMAFYNSPLFNYLSMEIGVKIGQENWQTVLEKTKAKYCEVWFNFDWQDRFKKIFNFLSYNNIYFGLHFWATLPGNLEPNLAFEPNDVARQSQELIKQCIDIAKKIGAKYVNVHPGSLILKKIDLEQKQMTVLSSMEVPLKNAKISLLKRTKELQIYAQKAGVLLLVETVPTNEAEFWRNHHAGRVKIQIAKNISPELIVDLAKQGVYITNDIAHTTSSWVTQDRILLFSNLLQLTKQLAPQTKLIHINTVAPPFNGTDSHNGILEKDFTSSVFPNKNQVLEILKIFKDREDVWIIPEPEAENMIENYFALKKIMQQL